ncbi:MAG: homoserine O-acetyltransferase [Alphaproteobacteria bacterium]|nr:homoserine O-acetyltransferase [Alphaproteobacteria bacterium]
MESHRTTSVVGPNYREVEVGEIATLAVERPLRLDCGVEIRSFPLAFQTYGTLNADKSNAILVCHGLTGDQYAASQHPVTGKPGWWEVLIGPGKVMDTERYFVIATNVIGGCMGSFGPKEINPATGKAYGLDFPVITVGDMVKAQALLVEALGISKLFSVIGGSMGGMQVLEWLARYPERLCSAMPIAAAARYSAQNIAFDEIGRQAIMADPDWRDGMYLEQKAFPSRGLAVARMTAHVTYLSEEALHRKFGRELQDKEQVTYGFGADFRIESYLRHQGAAFVERFDANSYLYITRAMDYFDIAQTHGGGNLSRAFKPSDTQICVVSFSSDWLFPTRQSQELVRALNAVAANVSFVEVNTDKGHDAFLLDVPEFFATVRGFLEGVTRKRRVA